MTIETILAEGGVWAPKAATKILIIDDEPVICHLLEIILEPLGYETLTAFGGQAGIELFSNRSPDMVLLDIQMPDMSGRDVVVEIKKRCGKRFVPVIFLTAVSDDEELANCIDAGGDDLIGKPFNQTLLEAKLRAWERIVRRFDAMFSAQRHTLDTFRKGNITHEEVEDLLNWYGESSQETAQESST